MKDKDILCKCGITFTFTVGEQKFYQKKEFTEPKKCEMCRLAAKRKKDGRNVELEEGKVFGECESCGMETILVEEVGLCGPCCFGEADTVMGNW